MKLNVVTNNWLEQGWELILALEAAGFPLKAAFWSQVGDSEEWRLFIASRLVEEEGPLIAYDHIDSALHKLKPQTGPSIYKLSLSDTSALGLESRLFKELKSRVPEAVRKTAKKLNADLGDLLTWDDKLVYKLG